MAKILILTLLFVGIAVLLLGIRVFFTRKGEFPQSHVDANPRLREKGLSCHRHQDAAAQVHKDLFDRIGESRPS